MDPRHGEISRAMRNRGVEISVPGEVSLLLLRYIDHHMPLMVIKNMFRKFMMFLLQAVLEIYAINSQGV